MVKMEDEEEKEVITAIRKMIEFHNKIRDELKKEEEFQEYLKN